MEIFIPVFGALLLHSGIIRLIDAIQMHYVSKRVSEKVYDYIHKDEDIDDEVANILAILRGKENHKTENKNDPDGEWRYLD